MTTALSSGKDVSPPWLSSFAAARFAGSGFVCHEREGSLM